ncbi:MAG: DMT family transporter [Cellvibrionaceae bacterium]
MSNDRKAILFGLAAVACWSTVAAAFKLSLQYSSPVQLVFYACVSSFVVLSVSVTLRKEWQDFFALSPAHWRRSFLYAILNPFLYYWVLFSAYDLLPAQQAQAINYSWALTMTLLAVPLLGHRLHWRDAIAALICYAGVVVVATKGALFSVQQMPFLGVALALFSTVLWALYWILNTKDQRSPVVGLMCNFLLSIPMVFTLCLWLGESLVVPWQGVLGAIYIGAFEMGLAFVFWLMAMKLTSRTANIANLIYLSPLVSLALIAWVLGEVILPATIVGLGMIIVGLLIQKKSGSKSL